MSPILPRPCADTGGSRRDREPPSRRPVLGYLTSGWKRGNLYSISDSYPGNYHLSESTNLTINWLIWQISEPTAHVVKARGGSQPLPSFPGGRAGNTYPGNTQVRLHRKAHQTAAPPAAVPSLCSQGKLCSPKARRICRQGGLPGAHPRQQGKRQPEECGRREQRRHLGTGLGRVEGRNRE